MEYKELVEQIRQGKQPSQLIENEVMAFGADRSDDIHNEVDQAQAFKEMFDNIAGAVPYVGPDWSAVVADRIREGDPEGMAELQTMAMKNRAQYAGTARIDAGGSYPMWDAIHKSLVATMTNELPPQV